MIYLLRHGDVKGKQPKKYIGHTDLKLSEKGILQARYWRDYFSGTSFKKIYSSDLSRTQKTAQIICRSELNTITTSKQLREIYLGDWEGKTFHAIKSHFPDEWEKRGNDIFYYQPPGGESFFDLSNRVIPYFHKICGQAQADILIVTHAGVIKTLLCHILGKNGKDLFDISQKYGALNILNKTGSRFRLEQVNLLPRV